MEQQFGDIWSWDHCPRANIFRRDQGTVINLADMQHLMRSNDYKNDPLSLGDPGNAIASRFDLETSNPMGFGAIDSKIASVSLVNNFTCYAAAGPTHQSLPPFEWTAQFDSQPHWGQPTVFDFDWVLVTL
jgi:hypothetical protein